MIARFPQPRWNVGPTTLGYIVVSMIGSIAVVIVSIGLWFGAYTQRVM